MEIVLLIIIAVLLYALVYSIIFWGKTVANLENKKNIKVKFRSLHKDAVLPTYAHPSDAGMDLKAVKVGYLKGKQQAKYYFGLSIEIPEGYVGLIFPRSSVYKKNQDMSNCVGVIDSGYRGEISAIFNRTKEQGAKIYKKGDKVAQLIILPYPTVQPEWADDLSESDRGTNGYGSTGN